MHLPKRASRSSLATLCVLLAGVCLHQGCSFDPSDLSTSPYDGGALYDYYPGTERFDTVGTNAFVLTSEDSLSTFGIDVDAGSYTFGRKKVREGIRPPMQSVRVEEYVNYFRQDYTPPASEPFSVHVDGGKSLFRPESLHVLRVGIQAREPSSQQRRPWNITFLVDISGSMSARLDFVKHCLYILVDSMHIGDLISVCTYAGAVGTVLYPTSIDDTGKESIKGIIAELEAGGSTAMASGIQNAYDVNMSAFLDDGVNRVIVCSDGDANVGATGHTDILQLIREYVDRGITLSTLGFGSGNYNDYLMEQLADCGNGNYYYIDCAEEARRLFGEELIAMMEVIARDVKVQVAFNPRSVFRYRLIGYENRAIADTDFTNDTTDAGEIGAGHRVTALYELELATGADGDLGVVHLRYKLPVGGSDIPLAVPIGRAALGAGGQRFKLTQAVAEYAEMLRDSPYTASTPEQVEAQLRLYHDPSDERDTELLELCGMVGSLM